MAVAEPVARSVVEPLSTPAWQAAPPPVAVPEPQVVAEPVFHPTPYSQPQAAASSFSFEAPTSSVDHWARLLRQGWPASEPIPVPPEPAHIAPPPPLPAPSTTGGGGSRDDTGSYEWAINRILELELDLSRAVTALERLEGDNAVLSNVHSELAASHRRLQDQHKRVAIQVEKEKEDRLDLIEQYDLSEARLRAQLEARTRDLEDLQSRRIQLPPRELQALRMQITSEVEAEFEEKIGHFEQQVSAEKRRISELQQQMRQQQSAANTREQKLAEEIADLRSGMKDKESAWKRERDELQALADRTVLAESRQSLLETKLEECHSKSEGLQNIVRELEAQSEREKNLLSSELRAKADELNKAQKAVRALEMRLTQEESSSEELQTRLDAALSDQVRSKALIAELKLEVENVRSSRSAAHDSDIERLQGELRLTASRYEDELAQLMAKHEATAKAAQSSRESAQASDALVSELRSEISQLEISHANELREAERSQVQTVADLRATVEALEKELEVRKREARQQEQDLLQQSEDAGLRAQAMEEELIVKRAEVDEVKQRCHHIVEDIRSEKRILQEKLLDVKSTHQEELQALKERHSIDLEALKEKRHVELESLHERHQGILQHKEAELEASRRDRDAAVLSASQAAESKRLAEAEMVRVEATRGALEASRATLEAEVRRQHEEVDRACERQSLAEREVQRAKEEVLVLERQAKDQASLIDKLQTALQQREKRSTLLQEELSALSEKLDKEREHWARESDSRLDARLSEQEKLRVAELDSLKQEHKRQLLQFKAASSKAIQSVGEKSRQYKAKIQELNKRVAHLQQERELAVRMCEENRHSFESALTDPGMARLIPMRASHDSFSMLRSTQDFVRALDQQAAYLRDRAGAADDVGSRTSADD